MSKINTVNKAIQHFEWKLINVWDASQKDIDAYNVLDKFTKDKQKEQYNDNQLLGKIFITFYGELIKYYQGSLFDKEPLKALNKILDTPMETIIQKFTDKVNEQEVYLKMKNAGISDKHPMLKTDKDKESEKGKFSLDMLEPEITTEQAEELLTSLINNALNNFK